MSGSRVGRGERTPAVEWYVHLLMVPRRPPPASSTSQSSPPTRGPYIGNAASHPSSRRCRAPRWTSKCAPRRARWASRRSSPVPTTPAQGAPKQDFRHPVEEDRSTRRKIVLNRTRRYSHPELSRPSRWSCGRAASLSCRSPGRRWSSRPPTPTSSSSRARRPRRRAARLPRAPRTAPLRRVAARRRRAPPRNQRCQAPRRPAAAPRLSFQRRRPSRCAPRCGRTTRAPTASSSSTPSSRAATVVVGVAACARLASAHAVAGGRSPGCGPSRARLVDYGALLASVAPASVAAPTSLAAADAPAAGAADGRCDGRRAAAGGFAPPRVAPPTPTPMPTPPPVPAPAAGCASQPRAAGGRRAAGAQSAYNPSLLAWSADDAAPSRRRAAAPAAELGVRRGAAADAAAAAAIGGRGGRAALRQRPRPALAAKNILDSVFIYMFGPRRAQCGAGGRVGGGPGGRGAGKEYGAGTEAASSGRRFLLQISDRKPHLRARARGGR